CLSPSPLKIPKSPSITLSIVFPSLSINGSTFWKSKPTASMANNKAKSTVFRKRIYTYKSDKLKFLMDRCCVLGIIARILNNGDHSFTQPSHKELSLFSVKRSRLATKASLSRTNEASLSAVISRLEQQWHMAEDFRRRDKKTEEERRLRDTWRKIQGEDDWAGLTTGWTRSELIRYGEMAQACYDAFDFDPSSRYCGNPHRVLASKCITSPFRSDMGCWFDEALRTQAVLLEAGFLNIFAIWRGAGDCNCKQEAHLRRQLVHHNVSRNWYLHPSGVEKNQNLLQLQLVILELGLNSFI
ncbi:LOW QUALITY PROTEIN: hypothetical protein HID58_087929, partial [Brassica napus]